MVTPEKTIAQLIEDDHERLKGLVGTISDDIAGEPPTPFNPWKLTLLRTLRDFQSQLWKHFDLEEEGGFMDDVALRAPQHHPQAEALMREHEDFARTLEAILSTLKDIGTPAAWHASDVPARLRALFDMLKEHEAAEASLLLDTYYQDLGASD